MRVSRLAVTAVLVVVGAGCAQVAAPGETTSTAPSAVSVSAPPTSTPRPPDPTPLNPAPAELLGKWSTDFGDDDIATIRISPTSIRITRFATANIRLEVLGDELVLSHSEFCIGEGRYRWTIEGDQLRFDSITPDACDGRAKSFDGVTFTRVSD